MPRSREFDPSDALDRAMGLFWERGYSDTSMDDLVQATGVSRYGIYGAFGNKRDLFQAALDRYVQMMRRGVQRGLRKRDAALPEIQRYFDDLFQLAEREEGGGGCLVCNTATQVAPHDSAIAASVQAVFDDLAAVFARALRNARTRGQVAETLDPEAAGRYLTGVMQSAAVMARAGYDRERIARDVHFALSRLG